MTVVANPRFGLVNQENISFSELQRLPLILPTSVFGIRQEIDATAGKVGVKIKPQLEINSLPMTIMLVRENPLATILPPTTVSAHVARGDLICHRIIEPAVSRKLYAIYSDSRPLNTPERNFIRLLRDGMAIIPPKTP
jgi:DNA-binding transcriptional LysR family regulator